MKGRYIFLIIVLMIIFAIFLAFFMDGKYSFTVKDAEDQRQLIEASNGLLDFLPDNITIDKVNIQQRFPDGMTMKITMYAKSLDGFYDIFHNNEVQNIKKNKDSYKIQYDIFFDDTIFDDYLIQRAKQK